MDADEEAEAHNFNAFLQTIQQRIPWVSAGILIAGVLSNFLATGWRALVTGIPLGAGLGWVVWAVFLGINDTLMYDLYNRRARGGGARGVFRSVSASARGYPRAGACAAETGVGVCLW